MIVERFNFKKTFSLPPWSLLLLKLPNGEFKKLRRLLQHQRHIKIELCVRVNVLWWFQGGHVVQNRRSALSTACYEWYSRKGREWKILCCGLTLPSEPKIGKFHVVIWQTASKFCPKRRAARAAWLFSSSSQSNPLFVALTLPSLLSLPNDSSEFNSNRL